MQLLFPIVSKEHYLKPQLLWIKISVYYNNCSKEKRLLINFENLLDMALFETNRASTRSTSISILRKSTTILVEILIFISSTWNLGKEKGIVFWAINFVIGGSNGHIIISWYWTFFFTGLMKIQGSPIWTIYISNSSAVSMTRNAAEFFFW